VFPFVKIIQKEPHQYCLSRPGTPLAELFTYHILVHICAPLHLKIFDSGGGIAQTLQLMLDTAHRRLPTRG
jgi:hypothetical protein